MSDPLSVAGSIVGVVSLGITASQGLINYYEAFRGQQSAIDHTTRKLAHLRDFLDDLRRQLDARNSQHEDDDLLSSVRSSVEDCAAAIYGLKDELNKFDKTFRPGTMAGLLAAGRRVAYPFRERTLQRLNEDVDDVISCLSFAVQVLQQSDIGNIQRGIADIQVSIDDNRALLDLVRGSQVSSEIRAWLKAPDASINFNEILKRKHPGTGSWFTEGPDFTTWLTKPNSFLWLAGFAGCGKSVLASTTIHSVFQHRRGHPRIGVAFFFFTFNDESKQDASAMLRALVLQLSSQLGHGHTHLSGLYDAYRHATPPESALLECLHDVIRDFNDVYIVLDALDESPRQKHRGTLLDILADLRKDEPGLHLLVSSRDEVDIREGLKALPEETIKLKNEFIDRDIASFISQYLQQRLQRWAEFHDKIETALTTGAKGVFRWVECQFKILADCPESEDLLEKQLESLPPTLDETYRRMLDNIPLASKPYARQMLAVLCCASRPLKVDELTDAIAVQLDDPPTYNTKRKLKNAEAIHRVCPGLVEIDKDRYYGDTVRLAHFSIREFLELDPGSERIDAGFYRVVPQDAHTDVASICLAVLRELVPLEPATLALQFYAARYWPEHYRSGRADRLEAQILQLFTHHSLFVKWVATWDADRFRLTDEIASPLYYASLLGIDSVIVNLLQGGDTAYLTDGVNQSQEVLEGGQADCRERTQAPDNTRAIVNALGGYYGTALQAAAWQGQQTVTQLLLDNGADINAQGGCYGTALQAAVWKGHHTITQLLLDHGADINAQAGYFGTALQAAAAGGHQTITQLLLDNGADINAQGGYFGTALQAAAVGGHQTITQLLLGRGADITLYQVIGLFGITHGIGQGHETIIQLLLEKLMSTRRSQEKRGRGALLEGQIRDCTLSGIEPVP